MDEKEYLTLMDAVRSGKELQLKCIENLDNFNHYEARMLTLTSANNAMLGLIGSELIKIRAIIDTHDNELKE